METINKITGEIVDAAIKVHSRLGPGMFESVYEEVLCFELTKRGFSVKRQMPMPVIYEDLIMDVAFRIDLMVEDLVIVEIKSVEAIGAIHKKQTLNYLRLAGMQIGLLINFNEILLKNGIIRLFNNYAK
jgi:GxxExxY protein